MSDTLENLDGGLPHCNNPADKLDSKMSERERFKKEVCHHCVDRVCEMVLNYDKACYSNHLETRLTQSDEKLSKVRGWVEKSKKKNDSDPMFNAGWESAVDCIKQIIGEKE